MEIKQLINKLLENDIQYFKSNDALFIRESDIAYMHLYFLCGNFTYNDYNSLELHLDTISITLHMDNNRCLFATDKLGLCSYIWSYDYKEIFTEYRRWKMKTF